MSNHSTRGNARPVEVDSRLLLKLTNANDPVECAKVAIDCGFWPVPISIDGDGKKPIGKGWRRKWSIQEIESHYKSRKAYGVGLILGPGPENPIIDFDLDTDGAIDSMNELFGPNPEYTLGFRSSRGFHWLYQWDDRLSEIETAVYYWSHKPDAECVEIRLGTGGKAAQTIIPPSYHKTAKMSRIWMLPANGNIRINRLPESVIDRLLSDIRKGKARSEAARAKPVETGLNGSKGLEKRLDGILKQQCKAIEGAMPGDRKKGRHPTARNAAILISGYLNGHNRLDLSGTFKAALRAAYVNSKPEYDPDDSEFDTCIDDGWWYGLNVKPALHLEDRPLSEVAKATDRPEIRSVSLSSASATPEKVIDVEVITDADDELQAPTYNQWAENRAAMVWHWPGWIPSNQLVLVSGDCFAGKSTLLVYLLVLMTTGKPWPDGSTNKIESDKPVLYLDADNRSDLIGDAFRRAGGDTEKLRLATLPGNIHTPLFLNTGESFEILRKYIKGTKPSCVVIDTIARASDIDLTSPQQLSAFTKPLAQMAQDFSVPIFMLGHTNASGQAYGRHVQAVITSSWLVSHDTVTGRRTLSCEFTRAARPDSISFDIGENGCENFSVLAIPEGGSVTEQADNAIIRILATANQALTYGKLKQQFMEIKVGSEGTFKRSLAALQKSNRVKKRDFEPNSGGKFPVYYTDEQPPQPENQTPASEETPF